MRLAALAILLLSVTLTGCNRATGPYRVHEDPYRGIKVYSSSDAGTLYSDKIDGAHMWIWASRTPMPSERMPYLDKINVQVKTDQWMFIEGGESLVLLVDGEKFPLYSKKGSRGDRDVISGRNLKEVASYLANPDLLRKIASAKAVSLRLYGKKYALQRRFGPEHVEAFRKYVINVIDGTPK